jgi:hypothetical protein
MKTIAQLRTQLRALLALAAVLAAPASHAGGPRFIVGSAYSTAGSVMPFYTSTPLYYTDPGDLSVTVTSAQADAMVAAAAAVWNIPQVSLVLTQGGKLNQHVSGANSYFDGISVVFPADVQPTNYLAKPIAIVYDTDGSIIDLLLGGGASDPSSCRQNGVIESVDAFNQVNPAIDHAVIVLNGRCINSPTARPQQLLQMQYQVTRIFGRILGLSWSQLNDNVFTGVSVPTTFQMNNWPVMHPIDILCGPYAYQCMTHPFSLRDDDINALALLYYAQYSGTPPAGKQNTKYQSVPTLGLASFPTGQEAELVNLTLTRGPASANWDPAPTIATVTGVQFQQNGGNPVSGPEPAALNAGSPEPIYEGVYYMEWVPLGPVFSNLQMTTESINPLYTGDYAVGAYQRPVIAMPGQQQSIYGWTIGSGLNSWGSNFTLNGAPNSCNTGNDGSEAGPATADPSGWWSGLICGVGHASWFSTTIRAHHTWTLEATALNATGQPTLNALQPVLGVWSATDPTGSLPSIAAAPAAMNSFVLGTTQLHVPAPTTDTTIRLTVADQYGAGRPDFPYTGRILYADSIAPTSLPQSGGQITITGMGFRKGNTVRVNGVLATVYSWSSTQIVAVAPSQAATGAASAPVDILVTDPSTGGTTTVPAALTYLDIAPTQTVVITTPNAYLAAGAAAQWTLSLTATENGLPAASAPITWTSASALTLTATQTSTSAAGLATAVVSTGPIAAASTGTVTACGWITICANWLVHGIDSTLWRIVITTGANQSIAAGSSFAPVNLQVTDTAGHPLPGASVTIHQVAYAWEGTCTTLTRCPAAPTLATATTTTISDIDGLVAVTPLQPTATAYTVAIAASTGSSGFTTTILSVAP